MKNLTLPLLALILLSACTSPVTNESSRWVAPVQDTAELTLDFYDNEPTFDLATEGYIEVTGEVTAPGRVSLTDFPLRSLIVKETWVDQDEVRFTGAYRYDGVSLADLLNGFVLQKKNQEEFPPVIDLYVVVHGSQGDSAVISWGELYYPVHRNEIIIATRVMRIVPSKTKDLWPLPEASRLVVGSDLITLRNLSQPVRIEVKSVGISYAINRDIEMWSPEMKILSGETLLQTLGRLPAGIEQQTFDQVFYGRGKGIHGTTPFRGALLKDLLKPDFPVSPDHIRSGLFVFAAVDGYRTAVTWSEIFNRNDRADLFIIDENNYENAGRFSCLFAADFFSDRAVKSMTEIRFIQP